TAQALVEPIGFGLRGAFENLNLYQAVTHQQSCREGRLDRLFVLAAHDHTVDDRVHVSDFCLLDREVVGEVDRFAANDQPADAFFADLCEDEVQLLAVKLEYGRAEFDFGALGQRQDRFQNLIRGAAGGALAAPRAVPFGDGGEQQIQVTADIGHGSDRGSRIASGGLLLNRYDRGEAIHEVHVGLRHLRDEALGVGGERLHVAALPFCIDG